VARQEVSQVLAASKSRVAKEDKIKEELKKGITTLELYGFDKILQSKRLKEA
jgi:hypothetical protein